MPGTVNLPFAGSRNGKRSARAPRNVSHEGELEACVGLAVCCSVVGLRSEAHFNCMF